jgi:hypothetical protein
VSDSAVHVIAPTGVYFVEDAKRILRLKESTIRREVREGRLRISKRAGRYFILGAWLLAWIRGGEVRRRETAANRLSAEDHRGV